MYQVQAALLRQTKVSRIFLTKMIFKTAHGSNEESKSLGTNVGPEFMSQMAQFSSLEQLQNLSLQAEANQALSLVGAEITVIKDGSS